MVNLNQSSGFRQYGYSGPAAIGPFRIDGRYGSTPLQDLERQIGTNGPVQGDRLCFSDASQSGASLVLFRASDEHSWVRQVFLASFRSCFGRRIRPACCFRRWRTERGIGLGDSIAKVRAAYGTPSEVTSGSGRVRATLDGLVPATSRQLGGMAAGNEMWTYRAKDLSSDLSVAEFGFAHGVVTWIWLSDEE